jgi:2-polyprenyl-6-methoxyphenol hydroxylase-like FAD-dependent oxidoreductase
MSQIIILGGSVAGLLSATLLARRGHQVTVLEKESRESVAPPADHTPAMRPGAPHAVQGHGFLARATIGVQRALPDVYQALLHAGVGELRLVDHMPPSIVDRLSRPGDDELVSLTSRRHTLDRVLVRVVAEVPCLDLRFDAEVQDLELSTAPSGAPRVTGVRIAGGQTMRADFVVDASGRRTLVPRWIKAHGIELPQEAWDCGLVYFTRHYRVRQGIRRPPLNRGIAAAAYLPSVLVGFFSG